VDELGLALACVIVERFTNPGASVLVAIDDTLLKRRGQRIHGTFWHHDATTNRRKFSRDGFRQRVFARAVAVANENRDAAGLTPLPLGLSPHKLRHTCCSLLSSAATSCRA